MIMKATEHDMYRLLDYKEKMSDKGGKLFWNFRTFGIFLLLTIAFGRVSVYS